MEEIKKMTNHLEYLFLNHLADGLIAGTIDIPSAQKLAAAFLQLEPFASVEDAQGKMGQFTRPYEQFAMLKEYIDGYHQQQQKDAMIEKMRAHLKEGHIDEALQVVKQ